MAAKAAIDTANTIGSELSEISSAAEIKQSFLFAAPEIFFPGGVTEDPDSLPQLTGQQLEAADDFLQQRVRAIYELAGDLAKTHPAYSKLAIGAVSFKRVKFTTTGRPEAVVDSEGVVFLDIRVLQAIFRAIVLEWMTTLDLKNQKGTRREMMMRDLKNQKATRREPNEKDAIRSFNAFVKSVKDAPSTSSLSLLKQFYLTKGNIFDALEGWSSERKMRSLARSAQERFASSIDFIFAHELAHRTLRHLEKRNLADFTNLDDSQRCEVLRNQEFEADEFSALVVVAGQFRGSRAHTIKSSGPGNYTLDGSGHIPDIYGYLSFFGRAMSIAGFDNRLGVGCTYPSSDSRMYAVHSFVLYSRDVLDVALHQEGVVKGQWFASRDDAKLSAILESGASFNEGMTMYRDMMRWLMDELAPSLEIDDSKIREPKGFDRQRSRVRYRDLVAPLLQQRFSGRV